MKFEFPQHIFEKKNSNIRSHENPSNESRVVAFRLIDGHDEANVRFSKFLRTHLKSYMFFLYETAIIRLQVLEI